MVSSYPPGIVFEHFFFKERYASRKVLNGQKHSGTHFSVPHDGAGTVKMKPRRNVHEKTQRFLRGWRERTYISRKFTVEMKPRRILHEKTQRFLRGRRDAHVHFT